MAREEATRRGNNPRDELALYIVHGLLHLTGYDDGNPGLRRRMYEREKEVLSKAGYDYVR
jgi:probable rRNA maturation factor